MLSWPPGDRCPEAEWFRARPFGANPADLDIDFHQSAIPTLVTRLLLGTLVRRDGTAFSSKEVWQWTLARRMQALLAVVVATSGRRLPLQLNCSRSACREFIELEIDLFGFVTPAVIGPLVFRPSPDAEVSIRLPTGDDQRNWLQDESAEFTRERLATRLVTGINGHAVPDDWTLPAVWLAPMSHELGLHDPLMDLQLDTCCPSCGSELAMELDLEATLLAVLAHQQQCLLDQIHCLASVYHWSESEIVALPAQRRQYYLRRLTQGAAR